MKVELFKHQKTALNLVLKHPYFGLFMDPGTGKTLVSLKAIEYRWKKGKINRVLIIVPKGIIFNWEEEIGKYLNIPYNLLILEDEGQQKRKTLIQDFYRDDITRLSTELLRDKLYYRNYYSREKLLNKLPFHLEIILMNYEKARIMYDELLPFRPDFLIVDESHKLRGRNNQAAKCIYQLTRKCSYRLLMTGTPICGGYEDLFMQYKIMDERVFGTSYGDFEDQYIIKGGYMDYEIKDYKNVEEIKQILKETSYRIRIEDCIELKKLPPLNIYCKLNKKSQKIYDSMNQDMIADLDKVQRDISRHKLKQKLKAYDIPYDAKEPYESLLLKASIYISSSSVNLLITKMLRLQQITGGFITSDAGEIIKINDSKLQALKEYSEDYKQPLIVICRFIHEIDLITQSLKNKKLGVITGKTKDRRKIVHDFQAGKLDMLIIQISAGSVGLNLYRASKIIFYSWNYNRDDYIQAIGRIKRNGQKYPWQVIHLVVKNSIDEKILKAIQYKENIANKVLD